MGLRGPGAKPPTVTAPGRRRGRPPAWEQRRLSRADRVIRFIESLTITSGAHAGRRFKVRPWQRTIIRAWYATDRTGRRIVRTGLLTIGRKNGKTTLVAALALAHLLGPEVEPRGQVVAAASDRDQSGLIFDELVALILGNPAFAARTNIQRHAKIIEDVVSGTKFRALSSDAKKAHGLSPSVIILDELAQWGHGLGRDLYTALTTSTGARGEPLTLIISTQTADEHAIMSQLVDDGQRVNAGEVSDPTFSPHIFTVPMDADPWDEAVWPLANPALGDFRSLAEMRVAAERAKRIPTETAMFRLYYLNQRVHAETHMIPLDAWDACATLPLGAPAGRPRAFLGLDLSSRQDLTALVILVPTAEGVDVRAEFWCPEEAIVERSQRDRVPYPLWVDQGYLVATPGRTVDYSAVEARIHALMARYTVAEVVVDPWNATDLTARLLRDSVPVVELPQTMPNLTSPTKALIGYVLDRQLRHDGHPVLRWCIGNAIADLDGTGNLKPSKKRALACQTPIPTPWGWTTMGEIRVGDTLYDDVGRPCRVLSVSEVATDHVCYAVHFSDGEEIIADAGHEWAVEDGRRRRSDRLTTEALLRLGLQQGHQRRFAIKVAGPLDLPDQDLVLDPYLLGCWLGDGSTGAGHLVTMEPEIVGAFAEHFVIHRLPDGSTGRAWMIRIDGLTRPLWELGIYARKRIPDVYLRASAKQRLALLQGLMDTDGHIGKPRGAHHRQCIFTNTNKNLIDGVHELVTSLGLQARKTYVRGRLGPWQEYWRVTFTTYGDLPPFRLPRKLSRLSPPPSRQRRSRLRQITGITLVPPVPVRCVTVDAPSHLYLAGRSMIPTHNSTEKIDGLSALVSALARALVEPGGSVYDRRGLLTVGAGA